MWGSHLLISPALDRNARTVFAYFPKARWFDFYTGKEVEGTGRIHELDVPLDYIPLHLRGGSIIVTQQSAINTRESRKNPFELIIAAGDDSQFTTEFYYDEGETIGNQL
jgi:alpha-glucosidase (family GH31 glycosyl hydrolase)